MKKRLMSKLLMGALVVLTMGVFSSCKDYDDDINANTVLINSLQSQVDQLKTAAAAAQSTADKAVADAAAAQSTANKALSDLAAAQTALEAAIAAGDEAAIKTATELIAKAKQEAIDAANAEAAKLAEAAAANAKKEMLEELEKKVAQLNTAIDGKVSQAEFDALVSRLGTDEETFNNAIKGILADIAALKDANIAQDNVTKAISDKLDELYENALRKGAYDEAIANLTTQIAAVDAKLVAMGDELKKYINDALAKLDEKYATIQALTTLEQTLNQNYYNKAYIDAIDARLGKVEGDLAKAIETMATQTQLQDLKNQIEAALALKADKTALDAAVQAINEQIATLATKQELTTAVNGITEQLNQLKQDLEALQAVSDTHALQAKLESEVARLEGEIAKLVTPAMLQTAIEGMQQTIMAAVGDEVGRLEGLIAGKADQSDVNTKYNTLFGLIEGLAANKADASEIGRLEGLISGISGSLNTIIGQNLNTRVGNIETELGSLQAALNDIANNILNDLPELPDFSDEQQARVYLGANAAASANNLANVLKAMANNINALYSSLASLNASITERLDNFNLFVIKDLTSLVYRPNSTDGYLYGFPVISATLLDPLSTLEKKITYNAGRNTVTVENGEPVTKQFDIIAEYWLNPSCADWTKYSFDFDEVPAKNQITRANALVGPAGVHVNNNKPIKVDDKGVATFAVTIDDATELNDALTQYSGNSSFAWITTVALQAVRNDANVNSTDTITSDYAILLPKYYKDLILARDDYTDGVQHDQGNQKNHLPTDYEAVKTENGSALFSYELAYNDADALVDLSAIGIHYNDGTADNAERTHEQVIQRGFEFKYTILTDKDAFVLDVQKDENGDETSATIKVKDNTDNTLVGKVANVLVELQPKGTGKTVAYGFISIIITSPTVDVNVTFADLNLVCDPDKSTWGTANNKVLVSKPWSEIKTLVETAIGVTGALDNYYWANETNDETLDTSSDLIKWKLTSPTNKDNKLGTIAQAANLTWTFTEAEVYTLFYTAARQPDPKPYTAMIRLEPKAGHPEFASVKITLTIPNEIYPTGEFSYTQRIRGYWFEQYEQNNRISRTDVPEDRFEIHANVETVAEPGADDEFFFNIANAFFNTKAGQAGYNTGDEILIYDTKGFNYGDLATVYFDATKYPIRKSGAISYPANTPESDYTAVGASGAKYILFLEDTDSKILKAAKETADGTAWNFSEIQDVVVLSGTYNNMATYQGWKYSDGTNKDDYAFAYDLLNHAGHAYMAKGQTFVTHMILDQREYCFPIDFTANESFKFDIRWMRPISVNESDKIVLQDARDGGWQISIARNARFIDWRDVPFSISNINYFKYYGIVAIKPNLDKARTNINGRATETIPGVVEKGEYYPLSMFQPGLLFTDETKTYTAGTYTELTSTTKIDDAFGYITYYNNGLNVGDFEIYLPVTVVYDWGETAEQTITFVIEKTKGQEIHARQQ